MADDTIANAFDQTADPQPHVQNQQGIGAPVERLEDARLTTGNGTFTANINRPDMLHGFVLRSPIGHARIRNIDVSAAQQVPGLVAILTGEDYAADGLGHLPCVSIPPTLTGGPYCETEFPALARDVVRCVGAEVAFVIAQTAAAAEDAAELIVVDYDPLSVAPTLEAAIAPDAPNIWPAAPDNICFTHELGDAGATDAAFAQADHITRARIRNQRVAGNPLEPRSCVGEWDAATGRMRLTSATANPHRIRLLLAEHIFRVPAHQIHVIAGDVGGGFGTKGGLYPEEVLVTWAARRLGRAVKWVCGRSEAFVADFNGRDQIAEAEFALRKDGKVLGVRVNVHHNMGCQLGPSTAFPPLVGTRLLSGTYAFDAMHVTVNGVFTNSRTLTTYRGAGRPEAALVIEQMMDRAARELGLDRVEIRRKNMIRADQMPYKTAIGTIYDCGEYEALMDQALELADWHGFDKRRAQTEAKGLLRGRGLGMFCEVAATLYDRMTIRFDVGGGLTILAGTFSYGQGHETAFAQIAHEFLGVPLENIRFFQGDTDIIPIGRGTFGSRSMTVGGSALKAACEQVIERAGRAVALYLGCDRGDLRFENGRFKGPAQADIALDDVARAMCAWVQPKGWHMLPADLRSGLEGVGFFEADPQNYPYGCYLTEVEVDPQTGVVRLDTITGVDDVGTIINPLVLEGQMLGAVAQAVGQALKEAVIHDSEGQVLSGAFTDYAMPVAADFPPITLGSRPVPTKTNPLGVKGGAEAGTVGLPPAIVGAVLDALGPLGVNALSMPLTPQKVWQAIQDARMTPEGDIT